MRQGNSLKTAAKHLKTPGLISLGGGLPSSEYFPFEELSITVPSLASLSPSQPNGHADTSTLKAGKNEILTAGKHDLAEGVSLYDIATACQYGQGHGAAQFLRWMIEHTEIVHNPPYRDWSCTMTIGSTSACDFAFRLFCNPGDWMLTEQYTYPTMVVAAQGMGINIAAVGMDEHGMLATSLDDILSNWNVAERGGPKPFVVYTVPTGQNPTGFTQPLQRRKEIYAVAQKHDLYIFEDEPYYFLQMQPYTGANAPDVPPPTSHSDFIHSLVPSYLSLDVDGRVLRMDSFSKVIAPGSRVGWITASEQICEKYRMLSDLATQGPSGISQLVLFKLLDESWGHGGYLDWLIKIRMEYTERRDSILKACETYLPRDLVSWVAPSAGMFLWLEIDYKKHPHFTDKTLLEIEEEIFLKNIAHGTLLMCGSWFVAEQKAGKDTLFFRATYAAAPADQINEAIKRFGAAIRDSFGLAPLANGMH